MGNTEHIGRESAAYLVCGVASMCVSWAVMLAVNHICFGGGRYPSRVQDIMLGAANWTSGMLAAFVLTRRFVFRSSLPWHRALGRHTASRIGIFFFEQMLRQALLSAGLDLYAVTLGATGLSVVVNYLAAKFFVFHEDTSDTDKNA